MRLFGSQKMRPRLGGAGMELAGALSIASQMALLAPPGFDEMVRRELAGDLDASRHEAERPVRSR